MTNHNDASIISKILDERDEEHIEAESDAEHPKPAEINFEEFQIVTVLSSWRGFFEELPNCKKGEKLYLLERFDSKGWSYCCKMDKTTMGFIPNNYISDPIADPGPKSRDNSSSNNSNRKYSLFNKAVPAPFTGGNKRTMSRTTSDHNNASITNNSNNNNATSSVTTSNNTNTTDNNNNNDIRSSNKTPHHDHHLQSEVPKIVVERQQQQQQQQHQQHGPSRVGPTHSNAGRNIETNTVQKITREQQQRHAAEVLLRTFRTHATRRRVHGFCRLIRERINSTEEIKNSEEIYVNNLKTMIDLFLIPMRKKAEEKKPAKKSEKAKKTIETIFCNVEMIHNINNELLQSLKKTKSHAIGDALRTIVPFLRVYIPYINNYNDALTKFQEKKAKSETFAEFLKQAQSDPRAKGLSLRDFLIMPIQRIPRLEMLITKIVNYTPEGVPARTSLQNILDEVKKINLLINQRKKDMENTTKVAKLRTGNTLKRNQTLLKTTKKDSTFIFESLVKPYRQYVREGRLKILEVTGEHIRAGDYKEMHPATIWHTAFLASDAFFFWKDSETNKIKQIGSVGLAFAELEDIPGEKVVPSGVTALVSGGPTETLLSGTSFVLKTRITTVIITAANEEEKTCWFNDMKKSIEEERAYLSAKGVNDVPHLVSEYLDSVESLPTKKDQLLHVHNRYKDEKAKLKEVNEELQAQKKQAREVLEKLPKISATKNNLERLVAISGSSETEKTETILNQIQRAKELREKLLICLHGDTEEFVKLFGEEQLLNAIEETTLSIKRQRLSLQELRKQVSFHRPVRMIEYKRGKSHSTLAPPMAGPATGAGTSPSLKSGHRPPQPLDLSDAPHENEAAEGQRSNNRPSSPLAEFLVKNQFIRRQARAGTVHTAMPSPQPRLTSPQQLQTDDQDTEAVTNELAMAVNECNRESVAIPKQHVSSLLSTSPRADYLMQARYDALRLQYNMALERERALLINRQDILDRLKRSKAECLELQQKMSTSGPEVNSALKSFLEKVDQMAKETQVVSQQSEALEVAKARFDSAMQTTSTSEESIEAGLASLIQRAQATLDTLRSGNSAAVLSPRSGYNSNNNSNHHPVPQSSQERPEAANGNKSPTLAPANSGDKATAEYIALLKRQLEQSNKEKQELTRQVKRLLGVEASCDYLKQQLQYQREVNHRLSQMSKLMAQDLAETKAWVQKCEENILAMQRREWETTSNYLDLVNEYNDLRMKLDEVEISNHMAKLALLDPKEIRESLAEDHKRIGTRLQHPPAHFNNMAASGSPISARNAQSFGEDSASGLNATSFGVGVGAGAGAGAGGTGGTIDEDSDSTNNSSSYKDSTGGDYVDDDDHDDDTLSSGSNHQDEIEHEEKSIGRRIKHGLAKKPKRFLNNTLKRIAVVPHNWAANDSANVVPSPSSSSSSASTPKAFRHHHNKNSDSSSSSSNK